MPIVLKIQKWGALIMVIQIQVAALPLLLRSSAIGNILLEGQVRTVTTMIIMAPFQQTLDQPNIIGIICRLVLILTTQNQDTKTLPT